MAQFIEAATQLIFVDLFPRQHRVDLLQGLVRVEMAPTATPMGVLISWAKPATMRPSDAIFSLCSSSLRARVSSSMLLSSFSQLRRRSSSETPLIRTSSRKTLACARIDVCSLSRRPQ